MLTATDGSVCFGRNRITEINFENITDMHSVPSIFCSMPSNDDNYGHNLSALGHRPLLESLVGNDFKNEWLQPNDKYKTFAEWFKILR